MNRTVTLTDESGTPLGEMDLVAAHTNGGTLHRAISVYVFDDTKTLILLQQRSHTKPLFAGYWANTCCSHPYADESAKAAGERRLQEEMGFVSSLTEGPAFVYHAEDPNGEYTEHEYDILLLGTSDSAVRVMPDPKEVADWKWVNIEELQADMQKNSALYAPWFHLGLPKALSVLHHD